MDTSFSQHTYRKDVPVRMFRILILALCFTLAISAQSRMTVDQLSQMVQSSLALKHDDKKIAEYLKKIQLTEKLDDKTIEQFIGMAVGPRTIQALRDLRDQSANLALPAPKPQEAKPLVRTPPPGSAEQKEILDLIRQYAATYTQNIPDFLCLQVTRRFADVQGGDDWRLKDTVTAKLSYSDGHENYQTVLVNNGRQAVAREMRSMEQLGGAVSTGEFGSMMKDIFASKKPSCLRVGSLAHTARQAHGGLQLFHRFRSLKLHNRLQPRAANCHRI